MDVLRIATDDLLLTVAAHGVETAYARCRRKQLEAITSCTRYTWTGEAEKAELYHGENALMRPLRSNTPAPPVFFENKDYVFEIDFAKGVEHPCVHTQLREVEERFILRAERNFMVGVLNFGNDLGHAELVLRYERDGRMREFRLGFEVFSTKLDQQSDLKRIMADIEREYPLLVLDVMRNTYASFKAGGDNRADLVWWQVFAGIYEEFLRSARFILNKPHSRLLRQHRWERADQIKQATPWLEEELHQWRHEPEHRYRTVHRTLSIDTPENRFFKHAALNVARRFTRIRSRLLQHYGEALTNTYRNELDAVANDLRVINNHPLFRGVGEFQGFRQESLVLQRAPGYSAVYRNWIMLQRGMDLLEDMQRLQTKNIAELYQIWCFLEMKNILNDLLGKTQPDEVKLGLVQEKGLVLQLAEGQGSRLGYHLGNGEVLELFHEFTISGAQGRELATFTGTQRPDIALRVKRHDLKDDYVLTYLFDAKYRLLSDDRDDAPDLPPPDALNQMHRYRDAIYYLDRQSERPTPEKEVIGGYVLFPGEGDLDTIRRSDFYTAIEQVNIGAFPLRPGDAVQRRLLREHLHSIVQGSTGHLLADIRPQKRMRYDPVDPIVLVAVAKEGAQQAYLLNGTPDRYHTGAMKPGRFGDARMRYFSPYIGGKGVNCYFEILGYEVLPRDRIYPKSHPLHKAGDTSSRLVLHLGERAYINGGRFYPTEKGVTYFRYTKLSLLRAPREGKVELVLSEELDEVEEG